MRFFRSLFVFGLLCFPFVSQAGLRFTDYLEIPQWAEESIEKVKEKRIMTGFGDGSFGPKKQISRAAAMALLGRLMEHVEGFEPPEGYLDHDLPFQDVSEEDWFYDEVSLGYHMGWTKGRTPTTFDPGGTLTNVEWATLLVRAFNLDTDIEPEVYNIKDVPSKAWFAPSVKAVIDNELTRFPKAYYFRPSDIVTRGDAAWVMAKILGMPRLMGTSTESRFASRHKVANYRRVAIKPRDFNAEKQGYDIDKKALRLEVVPEGEVTMGMDSDYQKLGHITITNTLDDSSTFTDIQFKLRFERDTVGPEDGFAFIMENEDRRLEVNSNQRGEVVFTGLDIVLETAEVLMFDLYIKPRSDISFYQDKGHGSFYVFEAGGIVSRYFEGSARMGTRYAPVEVEGDREFSKIYFDPTR